MFIDEVILTVKAGNGGDGAATFRREKFIQFGGPDGGDGGKGGDIVFLADSNINTLIDFKYKKRLEAQNGENGRQGNHGHCYDGENNEQEKRYWEEEEPRRVEQTLRSDQNELHSVDAGFEWLGKELQRKGPPGRVAHYAQKPMHALTRARASGPAVFGAGDMANRMKRSVGGREYDMRAEGVEEKYRLEEEKRMAAKERRKERMEFEKDAKRIRAKETLAHVHGGSTPFGRRPHRVLGTAPGLKSPTSCPSYNEIGPATLHSPERQKRVFETYEKSSSSGWKSSSFNGMVRAHSAGRQRTVHGGGAGGAGGKGGRRSGGISMRDEDEPSVLSRAQSAGPVRSSFLVEKNEDQVSFSLFGLAERGVALRREKNGGRRRKNQSSLAALKFGAKQVGMKGRKIGSRGMRSGGSRLNKRPSTASSLRKKKTSLKESLLWEGERDRSGDVISTMSTRIGRRKKKRPKSAVPMRRSQSSAVEEEQQHVSSRHSIMSVPASAGRDRKRQALFNRCFKKMEVVEKRKEKRKKEGQSSSSSSGGGGGVGGGGGGDNGGDNGGVEDEYFLVLDGKIPPPVYLKKPKWDQYLIKK